MKGPTLLHIWLKISIANYHKMCIWIFNEDFSVSTYQILQPLYFVQSSRPTYRILRRSPYKRDLPHISSAMPL